MRSYRKLTVAAATLLVGPMLMAGAAHAAPTTKGAVWSPRLLSVEPLYDGSAVRRRYTDGITVVASVDARVTFQGSAPNIYSDGRRVYDRAVHIVDPQSARRSSPDAAAAYAAAGRSVYADALAAGFSPDEARQTDPGLLGEPLIDDSGCVYSEDNHPDPDYEWAGCYKLYEVPPSRPTAWYAASSGTAHGWGTGAFTGGKELQKGYNKITRSGAGVEMIEASPSASQSGNNCANFTIGLSHIIELGYQVPLCDDGWNVTWNHTVHNVEWHGSSTGGESDSRSASGANTVRAPLSTPTIRLDYEIGWTYICFC